LITKDPLVNKKENGFVVPTSPGSLLSEGYWGVMTSLVKEYWRVEQAILRGR